MDWTLAAWIGAVIVTTGLLVGTLLTKGEGWEGGEYIVLADVALIATAFEKPMLAVGAVVATTILAAADTTHRLQDQRQKRKQAQ